MTTTDDVYGLNRGLPLNYVSRDTVDDTLIDNLTRHKHIVIYGSSKQGKTSLRKHCLEPSDYIVIQCSNRWSIGDLHSAILKKSGFRIANSSSTGGGKGKLRFSVAFAEVEGEVGRESTTHETELELDVSDVNDVIDALERSGFKRFVILEDFHYLSVETQKDFAVSLKAFHESSCLCFIVIGVWLEENRLVVYNGDLTGRVVSVDADAWSHPELEEVIDKGAELLNIAFSSAFKNELISLSQKSVYIVQEVCREVCRDEHVFGPQPSIRQVGQGVDLVAKVKGIVNLQGARYRSFLSQFADGFQETNLEMYRWLLYPVLNASIKELEVGLTYSTMRGVLQTDHPLGEGLNLGNLTQALQSVANLQVRKEIKPIILDYDQTNRRLRVVDRGFLIWLDNQDRAELRSSLSLPREGGSIS